MAGVGPPPKERRARDRDSAKVATLTESRRLHGKALPTGVLPEGEKWHKQTLALWNALRRSPLLEKETELGWQFLIDTALMHHVMWTKGRWEFASEVRLRVAKFGATPEDRMRLKVKIEAPDRATASTRKPQSSPTVTDIRSRRKRLTE